MGQKLMSTTSKYQLMARAGYSARAVVFFLVGGLALFSGIAGGKSDTKSALDALTEQPMGRIWVGVIALGLLGFVLWRLAQSLGDADGQGQDLKGTVIRIALFGSAVAYAGLALYAVDRALALGSEGNGGGEKSLAMWAMSQPFGRYLAGAIGAGFVVGGIVTIAKGAMRKYERYLSPEARGRRPVTFACIYGLSARGALFVIVGGFFVYAALNVAPAEAGSLSDALNWIRGLPFGGLLYSVAAIGLASFGFYNLVQARYRIVRPPDFPQAAKDAAQTSASLVGFR
jgi:hypothetical protein